MGFPQPCILTLPPLIVLSANYRCVAAAIEEWVVSHVKQIIPESVQQQWHDWRAAAKGAEKEELGDNHVSEDIEKIGWGVEEAQQAHTADASKSIRFPSCCTYDSEFTVHRIRILEKERMS